MTIMDTFKADQVAGVASRGQVLGSCDCDFHQGRWKTSTYTFTSILLGGTLKYATEGQPIPMFPHCNKPKVNDCDDAGGKLRRAQDFATAKASTKISQKTGYNCSECKTFNEYASSNQPGDKYLCFNCRC